MKLQDQCCTLEQAKKLKELGVVQESLYCFYDGGFLKDLWGTIQTKEWRESKSVSATTYSAFTVAELSIMLLEYAETFYTKNGKWRIGDADIDFDTQAEASADRLIYLLENEILTTKEVNKRLNYE